MTAAMLCQFIIAIFGVTSIWFANDPVESRRKWACILGILSAPAFLWAAWEVNQWANFATSVLCLACWVRGFRQYWLPKPKEAVPEQAPVEMVRYPWKRDTSFDFLLPGCPYCGVKPKELHGKNCPAIWTAQREQIVADAEDRIEAIHRSKHGNRTD